MIRQNEDESLSFMNATVSLVLVVPLILMIWVMRERINREGGGRGGREKQGHHPGEEKDIGFSNRFSDQPPVITISEVEVYSFPSGKAEISREFRDYLRDVVVPQLATLSAMYSCDVIEVIGHTDAQIVHARSNLDSRLLLELAGTKSMLSPGSNADLGLMRAWAVANALLRDGRLSGKTCHAYSAAQAILPGGQTADERGRASADARRRRIEIRLRRLR